MNKSRLVFLFGVIFSRREAEAEGRETKGEAQREWTGEREKERRKVEEERKEGCPSGVISALD